MVVMPSGDGLMSPVGVASSASSGPASSVIPSSSWLSAVVMGRGSTGASAAEVLLSARTLPDTLRAWAAVRVPLGERLDRDSLCDLIGEDIASLDAALSRQLDAVLHHARFQALESSWRGLHWMVNEAATADTSGDGSGQIVVRVLTATKRELLRDREHAVEFDRSSIWHKVYEEEFGTPGGTPYGLLVTDFSFGPHPDDVALLTGLAEVAAAAFAPLVSSAAADLMGIDGFDHLNSFRDLRQYQQRPEFVKWRALRSRDESRFVGLTLPRVLGRLPYDGWIDIHRSGGAEQTFQRRGFRYREVVDSGGLDSRLWIRSAWAFAAVVMREFGRSGWFADIRGGSRGQPGGGEVTTLPIDGFSGLTSGEACRGPVEIALTDETQSQLEEAGLIPLCATGHDGKAVFHGNMSLHEPERYDRPSATANARISAMLQYILCVSRFAHYLKVMMRDKVGGFAEANELETYLSDWLNRYVTPDDQASAEIRAKLPLREARVEVREEPGTAGSFRVITHLQPHFQLDRVDATFKLVTTMMRQTRR